MSKRTPVNPFYVLLVLAGAAFFITAAAYCVMAFRSLHAPTVEQPAHALMTFLDRRGALLMGVEVALLAVATVCAMVLDHARIKQSDE